MSETNRDQETGQYTAPPPQSFGLEGQEREAGRIPLSDVMPAEEASPEEAPPEDVSLEKAAADLAASRRTPESQIKTYGAFNLPDNVYLSVDEAAKLKAKDDKAEREGLAEVEAERLRAEVDAERGTETEAKGDEHKAAEPKAEEPHEVKADPDHSEVERLLAIPHVREAVDRLDGEYRQGIDAANFMARAGLVELIPDVLSYPPEHQAAAFAALAQSDPARHGKAAALLNRANQLTTLHQEQSRAKAAAEEQEFAQYARAESAAFNDTIKGETPEHVRAVERAIIDSIKEYGGDDAEFFELFKSTKLLQSRVAQRLLFDAGQYRLIQAAKSTVSARALPPVQRPGLAQPRGNKAAANVAALQNEMKGASPTRQLELGAKILAAKRAARA